MRFPIASIIFVIASFVFFIIWACMSYFIDQFTTALTPYAPSQAQETMTLLTNAFGFFGVLFFFIGVVLVFLLDSTRDEPETFWEAGYP